MFGFNIYFCIKQGKIATFFYITTRFSCKTTRWLPLHQPKPPEHLHRYIFIRTNEVFNFLYILLIDFSLLLFSREQIGKALFGNFLEIGTIDKAILTFQKIIISCL